MKNGKRIIFSARDTAAALYIAPLVELAVRDPRFCVTVVAQEPAFSILAQRGIDATLIKASHVNSPFEPAAEQLLIETGHLISMKRPEAIVVGLSSPGQGGIDEALLQIAKCPKFLLQDFWGEFNGFFGGKPHAFLVLDTSADELTRQKFATDCFIIGSPRHAGYNALDFQLLRKNGRAKIGVDTEPVIGWFGQALHHVEGYEEVIENWVEAVECLASRPTIVYKPHPRESDLQRRRTMELISKSNDQVRFMEAWPIEDALLTCDCVCSIMSNCLYDGAYLNFHSETPLLSTVSVLASDSLRSSLSTQIEFDALPYSRLGLAETVLDKNTLAARLEQAMSPAGIQKAWTNARQNLLSPDSAARDALTFIYNFCHDEQLSHKALVD